MTAMSAPRCNLGRDVTAAILLLLALVFPWNLYFGATVPDGRGGVFALLAVATVLSLASIVVGRRVDSALARRLRVALNVPYLALVFGLVLFDVVLTIRYGGSANVPGGVGPGAWLGVAGSLLSAQPPVSGDHWTRGWLRTTRIVGYASITLAVLSVVFNLFWRSKAAISTGPSGFGKQNIAIIATAVVYGAVALIAVIVASRWILQHSRVSRLAMIAVGTSTLVAGLIVWSLPIGRQIDGFHGIAQNTSTAGVGFEGYLAWVIAAAIFAVPTLLQLPTATHLWRQATRKGLILIIVWCVGSVLMRVTDLIVSVSLDLGYSPYDSAGMAAFDLVTAVLAAWLYINLTNRSLPVAVFASLCGVLFVLAVSRIVVGIALAPRVAGSPPELNNPVFGNDLAQQITSTFDVVLCGLALCILAAVIVSGRPVQPAPGGASPDTKTTRHSTSGTPRIFRAPGRTKPKIYRPSGDSRA